MSRVAFSRKSVKLRKFLGIRARLALLALMLVAPLLVERLRSMEETRAKQLAGRNTVVEHGLIRLVDQAGMVLAR